MPESDEHTLIAAAQQDPQHFDPFYRRYVPRIYAYAYRQTGSREVAEDITASTFEKALAHIDSYRPQGSSPAAWLYKIALNEIRKNYWKQRLLRPLHEADTSPVNVEQAVQAHEQTRVLWAALAHISQADRQLLTLRFFEELSSAEVANILGCSLPQLYLRLHRALKRLRKQIDHQAIEGVSYVSE
ncbi:MAG TPA: RNA polymerase sigma factor [Anaerolineales bacterium]|nr:RNA polymerase sigma factor [Anaerolineales bacterium]